MKISITRALVELKRLDQRIAQATISGLFVTRTQGSNQNKKLVDTQGTIQQFADNAKANLQSVLDLIKNRETLKSLIVESNAKTKVKVLGREVSVAAAIDLKQTVLARESLYNVITRQSASALQSVTTENSRLQTKIEGMINQMLGSDKTKVDVEASTQITKAQEAIYAQEVFDPINAPEVLKKLKDEIDQIKSELDFILSESNASTQIDVDFMKE